MATIAIVFHSGYGHTARVAEHVQKGATSAGAVVDLIAIDSEGNIPDPAWETLKNADAIIFGAPTYMGMASWQFKKFADASSKPWYTMEWKGKVAAGFTNSATLNGDKEMTISYLRLSLLSTRCFGRGRACTPPTPRRQLATISTISAAIAACS